MLGYVSVVRDEEELGGVQDRYARNVSLDTRVGRAGLEQRPGGRCCSAASGASGRPATPDGDFTEVVIGRSRPGAGSEVTPRPDRRGVPGAPSGPSRTGGGPPGYFPRTQPSGGFVALYADTGAIVAWGEMPRLDVDEGPGAELLRDADPKARLRPGARRVGPARRGRSPARGLTARPVARVARRSRRRGRSAACRRSPSSPAARSRSSSVSGCSTGCATWPPARRCPTTAASAARDSAASRAVTRTPGGHFDRRARDLLQPLLRLLAARLPARTGRSTGARSRCCSRPGLRPCRPVWTSGARRSGTFLRDYVDFDPLAVVHGLRRRTRGARASPPTRCTMRTLGARARRRSRVAIPQRLSDLLEAVLGRGASTWRVARGRSGCPWSPARAIRSIRATSGSCRSASTSRRRPAPRRPRRPQPLDTERLESARRARSAGASRPRSSRAASCRSPSSSATTIPSGARPGEPNLILPDDGRNLGDRAGADHRDAPADGARRGRAGQRRPPRDAARGDRGRRRAAPARPRPRSRLDPRDVDLVRAGMRAVVAGAHGTARQAGWDTVPREVYGKTGTAQVGPWWAAGDRPDEGPVAPLVRRLRRGAGPPAARVRLRPARAHGRRGGPDVRQRGPRLPRLVVRARGPTWAVRR